MDPQENQAPQVGNSFNTPSPQVPLQPQQTFTPQNPMTPQMPMTPMPQPKKSFSKLKFALVGVIASIFLFGGSAAAYMQFVVNSPDNIWQRGMSSTVKGLDAVSQTYSQNRDKPKKVDGTFKVVSPLAADGSVHMLADQKNADMTIDASASGARVSADVRMIDADSSENPDIYFQVKGLDSVGALLGLAGPEAAEFSDMLKTVDGQWYVVDHTLLDQLANQGGGDSKAPTLSQEDIDKITSSFLNVVKDDLFSTDSNKAVFEVSKNIGKEDFEGTKTYRYEVGVNKEHLKSFLTDMKAAMGSTKLADVVADFSGKSYDETINLDELFAEIEKQDFTNAKGDVWVEASGRYIRNIRLYPDAQSKDKNYFDISIPYKGDEVIPVVLKVTSDENGSSVTTTSGVEFNKANSDMHFYAKADIPGNDISAAMNFEYDFTIKATNDAPKAVKPDGAKNATELLSLIYGDMSGDFSSSLNQDEFNSLSNQFSVPSANDDTELQ